MGCCWDLGNCSKQQESLPCQAGVNKKGNLSNDDFAHFTTIICHAFMLRSDVGESGKLFDIIHYSSVGFPSGSKSKPAKHIFDFGVKFTLSTSQPLYFKKPYFERIESETS